MVELGFGMVVFAIKKALQIAPVKNSEEKLILNFQKQQWLLVLLSCLAIIQSSILFAHDTLHSCSVSVAESFAFNGWCTVEKTLDTTVIYPLTANAGVHNQFEYFFYILKGEESLAYWNEEPFAGHAHSELGVAVTKDDCIQSEIFKLCYSPTRK